MSRRRSVFPRSLNPESGMKISGGGTIDGSPTFHSLLNNNEAVRARGEGGGRRFVGVLRSCCKSLPDGVPCHRRLPPTGLVCSRSPFPLNWFPCDAIYDPFCFQVICSTGGKLSLYNQIWGGGGWLGGGCVNQVPTFIPHPQQFPHHRAFPPPRRDFTGFVSTSAEMERTHDYAQMQTSDPLPMSVCGRVCVCHPSSRSHDREENHTVTTVLMTAQRAYSSSFNLLSCQLFPL